METISALLQKWNKSTSERTKLQHTYLCIVVVVTIISGLIALIDADLAHRLVLIPGIALVAFLSNAIVWALLKVYGVARLDSKKSSIKK